MAIKGDCSPLLLVHTPTASRAVIKLTSEFLGYFLTFQWRGERGGGIVGAKRSGKVSRFSFWAMQVRRLAFARLIRVQRCSFFFAAHNAVKLRQQIAEGKVNDKVAIVAH